MDNNKKYKWYKIAGEQSELNFASNNLLQVHVNGRAICVAKGKGNLLYACTNRCPHAGGIITNGFMDALNNVVCPLHKYKYNLQNGRNVSGEGYHLKTYPIVQRGDGLYLGIEENAFLNWF